MPDSRWEEIMRAAIEEAEAIDCSLPEFCEGLKEMKSMLDERVEQVRNEVGDDR